MMNWLTGRQNGGQDRLTPRDREFVAELAKMLDGTGTGIRLADHIRDCERRYSEFRMANEKRHSDNTVRLDRQDTSLRWILSMAVSIMVAVIAVLVTTLVQGKHL